MRQIKKRQKLKISILKKRSRNFIRADFLLIFLVFILSIFGLIMVYDASVVEADQNFGDPYYYLKFQSLYFVIGWIGLLITGNLDYHYYKKVITPVFIANIILLILILIPGLGLAIKGARRWLDLGPVTFQPSETFKTVLMIYLAVWLEKKRGLIQFFALIGSILCLIVLEPDLGTAIVLIGATFLVYFISGAKVTKFIFSGLACLLGGLLLIFTSEYRKQRLLTFFNSEADPLGSSYHIQQILFALGSGGLSGLGIGQSMQKYRFLPEATSDSIFAIVGEEIGFIGACFLIIIFLLVIWKGFTIAKRAPDNFGKLLAAGITSWIGLQIFINLASMVTLTPLTGIPLPFLSYGGTSLVVALVSIGILLNISKQMTLVRQ